MLKVNPEERLSITELVNQLQEIAAARNVNPKSPITEVGRCRSEKHLLDIHLEFAVTVEQLNHFLLKQGLWKPQILSGG